MQRSLVSSLLALASLTAISGAIALERAIAQQADEAAAAEAAAEAEEEAEEEEALRAEAEAEEEEAAGRPYEGVDDAAAGVHVPQTICEGARIRRIRILGNRRVADEDVLAGIRLRAGRTCTDRQVTRDAQALWDLGFFDDIVVEGEVQSDDRIDLVFRVRERPAIGHVRYTGNDHVGSSDIDEVMTLREGSVLSRPDIASQVTRLRDLYAEKGYFLAHIEPEITTTENNQVDVVFHIEEGLEVSVRRIRFVGNHHVSDGELRGVMQTGETGFFSFLTNNDNFQQAHFDEDQTRLAATYYDRGFLQIHVGTPRIELTADRRYIDITIPVTEGPRFRLGHIRVTELDETGEEIDPLGGRRTLREMIPAQPGDWFNRTALAQALQSITRFYRDQGYAHAEVSPQMELDGETRAVDLTVAIQRGAPTTIERINIRGNTKTRDSVIRRELRISEGDLYSQTRLETSRAAVQALGYFEHVEMSESDGSRDDTIIVNFEVAERATGTFQVGAGFSSIESFILTAQINQQNLFGNGQSLSLQLQLSGLRQLIQLQLVEPYLFGTDWSAAIELFRTTRQYQAFSRNSTGGSLSLGHWLLDRRFTFFASYRGDYVEIGARTGGFFGSGTGAGLFQLPTLQLANLYRQGLSSSLRFTLQWDSRDNRLFPMNGLYIQASTEIADEILGSANTFVRTTAFVRWYWELFSGVVLKMNTTAGLITSRQTPGPPIFERFYLGGIFSVRGFPLNGLGPRVGLSQSTDPNAALGDTGIPVGGNAQFYYNLELEFPIIPQVQIRGVIFTDGGNAWNLDSYLCVPSAPVQDPSSDPCNYMRNPFDIRTSWGFGVRWISPLGPLRFEWGIPFIRRPWEQSVDFQFTIGNFF
ncbi:MAG: outer membrane protein assembly factor BamA [Sandaracinus sp.]